VELIFSLEDRGSIPTLPTLFFGFNMEDRYRGPSVIMAHEAHVLKVAHLIA
jgi:hypothetical protein